MARSQPQGNHPWRLPITVDVLRALFLVWSTTSDRYEATMLWAACTLVFLPFSSREGLLCHPLAVIHLCICQTSVLTAALTQLTWLLFFTLARPIHLELVVHCMLAVLG